MIQQVNTHPPGNLTQSPRPGTHRVHVQGDVLTVELTVPGNPNGAAFVRTNVGRANVRRHEIIDHVKNDHAVHHGDWHDIPMHAIDDNTYQLLLPLSEVGVFHAKALFLPAGSAEPIWPGGNDLVVKVESASRAATSIYSLFVRCFGRGITQHATSKTEATAEHVLDEAGYAVIPPSGTFRDVIPHLDHIVHTLGFGIIQLLPIFPTPTTFARMGRFGSPFAALDLTDVDPSLAEFDRRTTPMHQFEELTDATHARGARLFLDIPINHTGWASHLQVEHPEWFVKNDDNTFQSPGAWGTVWEDLSKLDYTQRGLWHHMAEVFLFWCSKGVDGFRCDAGYKVPINVWRYIVARVRDVYPDTTFLLEGLGGQWDTVKALLTRGNLDWAYSELFQNYDRTQIESYLPGCLDVSTTRGRLVHFAETHDNNRLAATSDTYARMRTALAALFSDAGAFGITNGVEWFATEKIDVHNTSSLNWGHGENMNGLIARLNTLTQSHPAFAPGATCHFVHGGAGNALALARTAPTNTDGVIVLVNLDCEHPVTVSWSRDTLPSTTEQELHDLLTDQPVAIDVSTGTPSCHLEPGAVRCLAAAPLPPATPWSRHQQRLHSLLLRAHVALTGNVDAHTLDLTALATAFKTNPVQCLATLAQTTLPPVAVFDSERDARRVVMVPAKHILLVRSQHPFSVDLADTETTLLHEDSLQLDTNRHVALLLPSAQPSGPHHLNLRRHDATATHRQTGHVLYLSTLNAASTELSVDTPAALTRSALCTNSRGAMARVRAAFGEIRSQYDAFLAANLNPDFPADRHVLLVRCRAWLVYQGYSQEIDRTCLTSFSAPDTRSAAWTLDIPAGQGKTVPLRIVLALDANHNAIGVSFTRTPSTESHHLTATEPVKIIVRPDVDDRTNHAKTKAYEGAEQAWPSAIHAHEKGFLFQPAPDRGLTMEITAGQFVPEPEWQYMVPHPEEAERGLGDSSDLFSPGYFACMLNGGESQQLTATVAPDTFQNHTVASLRGPESLPLTNAARRAVGQFLVKRDEGKTIIAGYPWFLDWGRDTLICLRGLIAAGLHDESRDILRTFASYEVNGTLPNTIHGSDISNRDTSDAPLWFCVACADLLDAEGNSELLTMDCGNRSLADVLLSIVHHYREGTPNGIHMDPGSGLIFSPSHFTWMDTNFPAGTPREGYPIEIQALWFAALRLMQRIDATGNWSELSDQVRTSITTRFSLPTVAYLSDCLHAQPGTPADKAVADDHVRPNQLFAITLGAVTEPNLARSILDACNELLVPGSIRSLADRPVQSKLVIQEDGQTLNDPLNPYWGTYSGDEDTRRKPAYHNGTTWAWVFPSYAEALFRVAGEPARDPAISLLTSSTTLFNRDCLGQISEITDGNTPHTPKGCDAQAWSITELLRVLAFLTSS